MRRRIRSDRRGRPRGSAPLFVEDCCRLDATDLLAKTRGGPSDDDLIVFPVTVRWSQYGQPRHRTLLLTVTSIAQRLGGVRRWWECPVCGRRCRILLIAVGDGPVGCRRCLGAVYSTDYPGRHFWRQFSAVLVGALREHSLTSLDERSREVDVLLAKRRRGVRRGRRILIRAVRALERFAREPDVIASLLKEYSAR